MKQFFTVFIAVGALLAVVAAVGMSQTGLAFAQTSAPAAGPTGASPTSASLTNTNSGGPARAL